MVRADVLELETIFSRSAKTQAFAQVSIPSESRISLPPLNQRIQVGPKAKFGYAGSMMVFGVIRVGARSSVFDSPIRYTGQDLEMLHENDHLKREFLMIY
ncbi:predicted protein [Histoplasma capsulatum G186AR]|uniref:Uncharacterized protein n=1 Tax=Ajellomyces capsulatus (strain G186AR / H82 / ATCC MYA-2454 / RMSCC 2432) TaxID=447093 RepID=C0NF50_AJECG|nr:uncharacterized protein HCBG_01516 [Histoplasma capsulatum G186AR]EEH09871.1 predicted protein [Histoplasma capsulatum G186AR]